MAKKGDDEQPVIIKKVIKKGGGHHGGAWKVAYADFVTAMMAFFLLLWLLNVATDEQLAAISGYFDPTHPKISENTSGAGGVLGGLTMSPDGSMTDNARPFIENPPIGNKTANDQNKDPDEEAIKEAMRKREEERFEEAKKQIEQAIQKTPELASLMNNLLIDMTPEGLRIQIVDRDGESMFPSGSTVMYEKTRKLMGKVADAIKKMPNEISVRGHTDAVPYGPGADYTNWELSADRANSTRRVLLDYGLPADRLNNVMGKAATEPLIPENPRDARNRRITMVLLREELTGGFSEAPPLSATGGIIKRKSAPPPKPFEKTEGEVYFP